MINITTLCVSTGLIILTAIVGMIAPIDIQSNGGALVVDFGTPMFQMNGMIFGGLGDHELIHHAQQLDVGNDVYYATVVVPSVLMNIGMAAVALIDPSIFLTQKQYEALPWESYTNNGR